MSLPEPKCLSLVLCDQVIEDKRTNKKSLIGLFNRITVDQLPALHPRLFIIVSLCNGHATVPITVTLDSITRPEPIFKMQKEVAFNNPLAVCDLIFELVQTPFKHEGTYAASVYANDKLLLERRFAVQARKGN